MAFDTIETPSGKAEGVLGGSVNYFSVAASFYTPVQVVGVVGEDFPQTHLTWLGKRKIDCTGIKVAPGKTFHWVGSYKENLNEAKTLSTCLNVFEKFDPTLTKEQCKAPYVFLANIDPVLQQKVLDQVENPKIVAADSMNFWITGKPAELLKTLKRVDILCINEAEAFMLAGTRNITQAAETIRKMGPAVVIIKRGEYGANLYTGKGVFFAPPFPVRSVIDPTGAGDSFAGAFMGYVAAAGLDRKMMKSKPLAWERILREGVVAGSVMASFTIEDFSLKRLMKLKPAELSRREKSLREMIRV